MQQRQSEDEKRAACSLLAVSQSGGGASFGKKRGGQLVVRSRETRSICTCEWFLRARSDYPPQALSNPRQPQYAVGAHPSLVDIF